MIIVLFLVGVIVLVIGVGASIALHELGHLAPAKLFGVKVTQYMIGFGPTLWSRKKGETEYGFKALPLGGYIRMIGMFPPADPDDPTKVRASSTGRWSQMVDAAREQSVEELAPADVPRTFFRLKSWQKIIIMLGGPTMNLLLGFVLIAIMACGIGLQRQTSTQIGNISPCLEKSCVGQPKSPAAAAGLADKDTFVSVAGVKVATTTDAVREIRKHPDQRIPIVVDRTENGRTVTRTLQITPARKTMPLVDANGAEILDLWGRPKTGSVGVIGAGIGGGTWEHYREPITQAPAIGWQMVGQTASVFVKIPQKMVGVFSAAFGDGKRDANGPMSVVGVSRAAGEVTSTKQLTNNDKLAILVGMLGSLNFALFVFNLVPLLPLDGGHVAGAILESIKRGWARLRGRRGPVYVDVAKAMPIAYGVSLVLVVMFGLLMYADIVNPVKFAN